MIDIDDLDRTLRAALIDAGEHEMTLTDPTPRVARRVARRRHRRTATRIGAVIAVAAVAAVTIGGLFSASTKQPVHSGPPPTAPTPSALLAPQTPADRAGLPLAANLGHGAIPSTIRLLQSQPHARLYGARDLSGGLCVVLELDDAKNQASTMTGCSDRALGDEQTRSGADRFALQGTAGSSDAQGRWAVYFFVPDTIKTVVLNGTRYPVTRNSVLIVADHSIGFEYRETRRGSTLYASK
jgi:hypothetical protein